jgi:hypothetical protein
MPSGVTFTRASTATYFDATGTLQTATANTPRWDYDPVTHALRGLLIEEARTNIVLWATDFTNAAWQVFNGAAKGSVITSPGGIATGMTLSFSTTNNSQMFQSLTVATGTIISVYARANSAASFQIRLSDGATSPVLNLTAQWQRFSYAYGGAGATNFGFQNVGTTAGSIDIAMPQIETGAFVTSYIPTTTAAVTRAVEAASLPTAAWFNATTGTMSVESQLPESPVVGTNREFLAIGADSSNVVRIVVANTANGLSCQDFTANINRGAANDSRVQVANVPFKCAATYTASLLSISSGGSVPTSVATTALPTFPTMWIGGGGRGAAASAPYRRVRYWPRVLTNAELQSVTT